MTEPAYTLHTGDCLRILPTLPAASVDAVVTDPPYSSGGLMRSDRAQTVAAKYVQSGSQRFAAHDFTGDNRDQRSWAYWCSLWLGECLRVVRPGGYCLLFTDWRQLPTVTDVVQGGGWVWRGLIAWDKGAAARAPNVNYFRHQCEYVVWGTAGPNEVLDDDKRGGPWPGCYQVPVHQADKHHVTGKPTELLRQLVQCCPPGGVVLDPFMGSGTTGVACQREGRRFIGVEMNPEYVEIARGRLGELVRLPGEQPGLFDYKEQSE